MPRPHRHGSELTPDQLAARERWQGRWNVPILLAALIPLFVNSPQSRTTQIVIGVGSWLVFVVDLFVQHRIDPDYLQRRRGRIDVAIVVATFPFYLLPGTGGFAWVLMFARLARVARVLIATRSAALRTAARQGRGGRGGDRRDLLAQCVRGRASDESRLRHDRRCALVGSRHAHDGRLRGHRSEDHGGAALGCRDHVHRSRRARRPGRVAASLFGLGGASEAADGPTEDTDAADRLPLQEELAALRMQLLAVEQRLAELPTGAGPESAN